MWGEGKLVAVHDGEAFAEIGGEHGVERFAGADEGVVAGVAAAAGDGPRPDIPAGPSGSLRRSIARGSQLRKWEIPCDRNELPVR